MLWYSSSAHENAPTPARAGSGNSDAEKSPVGSASPAPDSQVVLLAICPHGPGEVNSLVDWALKSFTDTRAFFSPFSGPLGWFVARFQERGGTLVVEGNSNDDLAAHPLQDRGHHR